MSKSGDRPRRAHNQRSMKRLLEANGWTETQGGKHVVKIDQAGPLGRVTAASRQGVAAATLPIGLTIAIMRQAGLRGGDE